MKIFLLTFTALSLTICSTEARLGEKTRQCAKRYGQPVSKKRLKDRPGYEYQYERGNFIINIRFTRSNRTAFHAYEATYLSFRKKDHSELDEKTVEKILQKNCPDQILYSKMSRDMFWEEVEDVKQEGIDKEWRRVYKYDEFAKGKKEEKTGYAGARANLSEDHVLVLTSEFPLPRGYDSWEERMEEQSIRKKESKAVEDFF